jgi:hypothetical protein
MHHQWPEPLLEKAPQKGIGNIEEQEQGEEKTIEDHEIIKTLNWNNELRKKFRDSNLII